MSPTPEGTASARERGTTARGIPFDESVVQAVWEKARPINGHAPDEWRSDGCGRIIRRSAYGDVRSPHGWEIDHHMPVASGGKDDIGNLRALHWELNRRKGDTFPWNCP